MKKLKVLLSALLLVLLSSNIFASNYWSGGYDEGRCTKKDCTCVAIDHASSALHNYCLTWNYNAPFAKAKLVINLHNKPHISYVCPNGADGPMSQQQAISEYFDVDLSSVKLRPKSHCSAVCNKHAANCAINHHV